MKTEVPPQKDKPANQNSRTARIPSPFAVEKAEVAVDEIIKTPDPHPIAREKERSVKRKPRNH